MFNRHSFTKLWMSGVIGALFFSHVQAGTRLVDITSSAIKNLPGAIATAAQGGYNGLQVIGEGDAFEGSIRLAAAWGVSWIALNGFALVKDYYRSNAPLKKIQDEIKNCASEKMNDNDIRSGLSARNINIEKIKQGLGTLDSKAAIESEIKQLEEIKKKLAPFLTLGSSIGIPQEVDMPLIHIYFNRFHATLDSLYKKHVENNKLSSSYCVQERLNNIPLEELKTMKEAVEKYLGSWTRIWPFFAIKPNYAFAAKLYWNVMVKIAYLHKCKIALEYNLLSSTLNIKQINNIYPQ